jgi:hypothetical protein
MRVILEAAGVWAIAILAGIAVYLSVALLFRPVSEITRLEVVGESPGHVMLSVTYTYTGEIDSGVSLVPKVLLDGRAARPISHMSWAATPGRHTTWISAWVPDRDERVAFKSNGIAILLVGRDGTISEMTIPHRRSWVRECDDCPAEGADDAG